MVPVNYFVQQANCPISVLKPPEDRRPLVRQSDVAIASKSADAKEHAAGRRQAKELAQRRLGAFEDKLGGRQMIILANVRRRAARLLSCVLGVYGCSRHEGLHRCRSVAVRQTGAHVCSTTAAPAANSRSPLRGNSALIQLSRV